MVFEEYKEDHFAELSPIKYKVTFPDAKKGCRSAVKSLCLLK